MNIEMPPQVYETVSRYHAEVDTEFGIERPLVTWDNGISHNCGSSCALHTLIAS